MNSSKDIEKQIQGIQDKSEKIKMEVPWSRVLRLEAMLTHDADYADTTVGAAVTASRRCIMKGLTAKRYHNEIPIQRLSDWLTLLRYWSSERGSAGALCLCFKVSLEPRICFL
jgi:hypothetical protein